MCILSRVLCSPYFQRLFSETPCKHPVIVLKDLPDWEMRAIIHFMYKGEINVGQEQLPLLLQAAETLQVRKHRDNIVYDCVEYCVMFVECVWLGSVRVPGKSRVSGKQIPGRRER